MPIVIDERTKIPMSVVGALAGLIAGVVFWMSSLYSLAVEANRVNDRQEQRIEVLYQMKEDVAVIKQILENKANNRR